MAKIFGGFDPESYATVAERIRLFYAAHPLGRIHTDLVSRTSEAVVFKASVYRSPDDDRPAATGWAAEREGDGEINLVACLENTETSAVGRALANLGFTAARERPSREEMVRSSRARQRLAIAERLKDPPESSNDAAPPELRLSAMDADPVTLQIDPLQREANQIVDALAVVRAATRLGMRRARGNQLRERMLDGRISGEERMRWLLLLQRWIEKRRADALRDPDSH